MLSNFLLHDKKTSAAKFFPVSRFLFPLHSHPAFENSRSAAPDDAGVARMVKAILLKYGYKHKLFSQKLRAVGKIFLPSAVGIGSGGP